MPRRHPGDGPPRPDAAVGPPDGRLRGAGPRRGAGAGHLPATPRRWSAPAATRWCSRASRSSWRETSPRSLRIPTIGIGAGVHCDGQVLVCYDLFGFNPDFKPKFVKRFADGYGVLRGAAETFFAEVKSGDLPRRRALASPARSARGCCRDSDPHRSPTIAGRAGEGRPGLRRPRLMRVVRTPAELSEWTETARRRGPAGWALVPTMGFLHPGHLRLMGASPGADRRHRGEHLREPHPVRPERGPGALPARPRGRPAPVREAGVDVVFTPEAGAMYPPGHRTFVEVTELQDGLCGARRPGHFRGVATVVTQLFALARPAPGGVRGEGLAAAADDPPAGAGPSPRGRGGGDAHRPRAGRAGDELPQRLPVASRADPGPRPGRGLAAARSRWAAGRARGERRCGRRSSAQLRAAEVREDYVALVEPRDPRAASSEPSGQTPGSWWRVSSGRPGSSTTRPSAARGRRRHGAEGSPGRAGRRHQPKGPRLLHRRGHGGGGPGPPRQRGEEPPGGGSPDG